MDKNTLLFTFMESSQNEYGYEFIVSLTNAISKYTQMEESANPSVFIYKGSNLRYALERTLFSRLSNNNNLYSVFKNYSNGIKKTSILVDSEEEKKILSIMCDQIDISHIYLRKNNELKKIIKKIFVRIGIVHLLKKCCQIVRNTLNKYRLKGLDAEIVFYPINERFIRISHPIAKAMAETTPVKYSYFPFNKKLRQYYYKNNIPFINSSLFGRKIEEFSLNESLLDKYGITAIYNIVSELFQIYTPKKAIVFEGNSYMNETVNQVYKRYGSSCICIQHGWSTLNENGFRNMSFDKMLVWGDGFAELMKPYNPNQNFISTGNPEVQFPDQNGKKTNDQIVISFFPQGVCRIISKDMMEAFISLIEWTIVNFPKVKVIVREHPLYEIDRIIKDAKVLNAVCKMSPKKYSLREVLKETDVSISINSTTIIESVASGVLPLIINITHEPSYWPDITKDGAGILAKSIEEAREIIKKIATQEIDLSDYREALEKTRKRYFKTDGRDAIKNIVREITKS